MQITGAKLFVEALKQENVDILFGYPGGYIIPIFDELYGDESINTIVPKHEQGLVHMADGYARSTGKPGVCLVTSGPGATNTITGIATAYYDSIPLICFTGQVPSNYIGNDAFQEADMVGLTRSITKHNFIVYDRKDLNRIIKEAFHIATTGRPGPVLVDLPVDTLKALGDPLYPDKIDIRGYKPNIKGHMGQIKRAANLLANAKKPLFLIGGGINLSGANEVFNELVDKTGVPAVSTLLGLGGLSGSHSKFIGMLGMHGSYAANNAVSNCDVLFSIGTRFNDRITGKLEKFAKNTTIIHVDIDPGSISRNVPVQIPIVGDAKSVIEQILPLAKESSINEWLDTIDSWKNEHPIKSTPGNSKLSPTDILQAMNNILPDAIYTTDVGQHQMWTAQHINIENPRSLISSGGLGTMGFGLPSALGAQIGNPNRKVVNISGDGGIQMNIQELATAVQLGLPTIICIFNNSYLGMVRQWQDLFNNKRYSGTCLRRTYECPKVCSGPSDQCPEYTPNFIKLAEAYGALGIRVKDSNEVIPALKKARLSNDRPVVIEFIIEEEYNVMPMIPSGAGLSEMLLD